MKLIYRDSFPHAGTSFERFWIAGKTDEFAGRQWVEIGYNTGGAALTPGWHLKRDSPYKPDLAFWRGGSPSTQRGGVYLNRTLTSPNQRIKFRFGSSTSGGSQFVGVMFKYDPVSGGGYALMYHRYTMQLVKFTTLNLSDTPTVLANPLGGQAQMNDVNGNLFTETDSQVADTGKAFTGELHALASGAIHVYAGDNYAQGYSPYLSMEAQDTTYAARSGYVGLIGGDAGPVACGSVDYFEAYELVNTQR